MARLHDPVKENKFPALLLLVVVVTVKHAEHHDPRSGDQDDDDDEMKLEQLWAHIPDQNLIPQKTLHWIVVLLSSWLKVRSGMKNASKQRPLLLALPNAHL